MNNTEKLHTAFSTALNIPLENVSEKLSYRSIPEWDSVAHMVLIAEIEREFDVLLDTNEIVDMSTVAIAGEILQKHGIVFP